MRAIGPLGGPTDLSVGSRSDKMPLHRCEFSGVSQAHEEASCSSGTRPIRGVAPIEVIPLFWVAAVGSLGTLPGRREPEEVLSEWAFCKWPLVPRHTGRFQGEPTCANPRRRVSSSITPPGKATSSSTSCSFVTHTLKAAYGPPRLDGLRSPKVAKQPGLPR